MRAEGSETNKSMANPSPKRQQYTRDRPAMTCAPKSLSNETALLLEQRAESRQLNRSVVFSGFGLL